MAQHSGMMSIHIHTYIYIYIYIRMHVRVSVRTLANDTCTGGTMISGIDRMIYVEVQLRYSLAIYLRNSY